MENVLNQMRRENDARVNSLPGEYRLAAQRMSKQLVYSDLSPFAVEDIRREIVGIAIEAKAKGQPLEEFLGTDEEGFCNEVIHSGQKRTLAERLAISLPVVAWASFAMLLVGMPATLFRWGSAFFSMTDIVVAGWMVAYVLFFSTYPKRRLVTVLWCVVLLQWYLLGTAPVFYPLWVRVAIQIALFAAAYWNRYRVYGQKAAEYGWNAA